jgi:peptidoglycan hydrolase CwlO-like protein
VLNGPVPRRAFPAALVAIFVGLALVLIPGVGQADPPPTLSQVRAQVHDLQEQAEMASESANELRDQVKDIRAHLAVLNADVARQQKVVDERRTQVGQFAAAQYRTGGIDTTTQLFLAKAPDDFLARLSTTESVNEQQAGSLATLAAEQKQLDENKAAATAELDRLTQAKQASDAKYQEAFDKLRQGKALLARLTKQERERLAAIQSAQQRRQDAAVRVSRDAQRAPIQTHSPSHSVSYTH